MHVQSEPSQLMDCLWLFPNISLRIKHQTAYPAHEASWEALTSNLTLPFAPKAHQVFLMLHMSALAFSTSGS